MPRRFFAQKVASSIGEVFEWEKPLSGFVTELRGDVSRRQPAEIVAPAPAVVPEAPPQVVAPPPRQVAPPPPPRVGFHEEEEEPEEEPAPKKMARAPFHNYGNSNVEPFSGGVVYGQ